MQTVVKAASRAWWATVLILVGVAAAIYFGYPHLDATWKTTTIKGILKKNARTCAQGQKEECVNAIIMQAQAETGTQIMHENVELPLCNTNNVHYKVSYRIELDYPLTGTMIGSKKKRYKRFDYIEKIKLSGY